MSGLRESNFRRIYIALKADLILTIILPLVFFVLLFVLNQQLERAGLNSNDINLNEVNHVSGFLPELLYAYLVSSFCASGLCSMLAVSGLGEAENCSLWLRRSRKWFTGCMLMAECLYGCRHGSRVGIVGIDHHRVLVRLHELRTVVTRHVGADGG